MARRRSGRSEHGGRGRVLTAAHNALGGRALTALTAVHRDTQRKKGMGIGELQCNFSLKFRVDLFIEGIKEREDSKNYLWRIVLNNEY